MSVKVVRNSRLRFADLLTTDGVEFWDTVDLPDIPIQTDDLTYTVNAVDRPDMLAYKFYGTPVLWWVIAKANDLELFPTELYEGQQLRIPASRYVLQQLFQKAKAQ